MKNNCDICNKETVISGKRYPKMLVVKDNIWEQVYKLAGGNKKSFICPNCMIKLFGRKFKYSELKKNSRGCVLPANIWYIKENNLIDEAFNDLIKETDLDVLDLYREEGIVFNILSTIK